MKKRYWMGVGLLGAAVGGWWLHRKGSGRLGNRMVSALAPVYDKMMQLWTGDDADFRQRLVDRAEVKWGGRVLDIGCGTGAFAMAAARSVGKEGAVIGIDPSDRMLNMARQKAEGSELPVSFKKASATNLPFPSARFNMVTATLTWHHLSPKQREAIVAEAARVLQLGGRFFVADIVPIAADPILGSSSFRVLKRERFRHRFSILFVLVAERITTSSRKRKKE